MTISRVFDTIADVARHTDEALDVSRASRGLKQASALKANSSQTFELSGADNLQKGMHAAQNTSDFTITRPYKSEALVSQADQDSAALWSEDLPTQRSQTAPADLPDMQERVFTLDSRAKQNLAIATAAFTTAGAIGVAAGVTATSER